MRVRQFIQQPRLRLKLFSDGLRIDTIATDIKVTTIQPGIVETDFSTVRFHGDKERAATVYQGIEALQLRILQIQWSM